MFAVATGSSTQEWAWSLVPELFRSVVPVAEGLGRECGSVFEAGSPSSARQLTRGGRCEVALSALTQSQVAQAQQALSIQQRRRVAGV